MKPSYFLLVILISCKTFTLAQRSLPDPFLMNNKQKVGTKEEWINTRRQELLHLFQENIYSPLPTARIEYFEQKSNCSTVYNNEVIIREVTLFFGNQAPCKSFRFTIISPKLIKKVPLIIGLNFSGTNQVLFPNKAKLNGDKRWNEYPIKDIINQQYGLVTCHYQDIIQDKAEVIINYQQATDTGNTPEGAISIWAWGLIRMMDYIERQDSIYKTDQVILYGFSRLGKVALWAGAHDERFSMVISNASGCGGAGLFRHHVYENIAQINKRFAYWFTPKFKQYSNNESSLPVDQHMLLGLIAPRPLYISNALNDQYVEPMSEFKAAKLAEPIYKLFGQKGIPDDTPQIEVPYWENRIGYHIRKGKHDITDFDWYNYFIFINKNQQSRYPPITSYKKKE